MQSKVYVDWGKLVQVVIITVATVVLALNRAIESETVALILGTGAGYIFGNGRTMRDGGTGPAPLIGRRPEPEPEHGDWP